MFWDRLLKSNLFKRGSKPQDKDLNDKDLNENENPEGSSTDNHINSRETDSGDSSPDNYTSQSLFEKPNLDFIDDNRSLDEMLLDLNLQDVALDKPLDFENTGEAVKDILYDAKDILIQDLDLNAFLNGEDVDEMEKDALKASLSSKEKSPSNTESTKKDKDSLFTASSNDIMSIFEPDEDIDSLIQAALQKDNDANEVSFDDYDREFVNETTVFHDAEATPFEIVNEKKDNMIIAFFKIIPLRTMYIMVGVLALLIIFIVATTVYIGMHNTMYNIIQKLPGGMLISQPKSPINNANFIYVGKGLKFNDDVLTLQKILLDSLGTAFYFNKPIDKENYEITLTDDKDKRYSMDFASMPTAEGDDGQASILRFQPLEVDVRYFVLKIKDPETGNEVDFYLALSSKIMLPGAKYVGSSGDLLPNTSNYGLFVENMIFSSAGSRLDFSLHWADDTQLIQLGKTSTDNLINMTEDKRIITPTVNSLKQYYFPDDKMILGRMDFSPLRNLNSTVTVTFTDIYKKYLLDLQINAENLFKNINENEMTIQLNEYMLVLERAGWQSSKLILVGHTEVINLYAVSGTSQYYENRAEAFLDVKVRIEKAPGDEIVLVGECKSSPVGMDIIFDAGESHKELKAISFDKYTFEISNAYVKSDNIEFSYDLNRARNKHGLALDNVEKAVIESFYKRLAFKSGELDILSVNGFSDELLTADYLLQNYTPVAESDAVYSAMISTCSFDEYKFNAVIAEYWNGIVEGQKKAEFKMHQITAVLKEEGWIITNDKVIQ